MRIAALTAAVFAAVSFSAPVHAAELDSKAIENAEPAAAATASDAADPALIRLQILLDRSRFSPGVIDGHDGDNLQKAIRAYEEANGLDVDGKPDPALLQKLTAEDTAPVLKRYKISKEDAAGPFVKEIPDKLEDMTKLKRLSYRTPRELLAEKFHMDEDLLAALNPDAGFGEAGTEITVADVKSRDEPERVTRIEVLKSLGGLNAYDDNSDLVAFYPASIGSAGMPSPSGIHKVRAIAPRPKYYYDPKQLNFSGVETKELLEIAAGPNNPVGSVWIDLAEPTYGIHGTPDPELIAKSESHGCVRLTNWDAEELSKMVKKGTEVEFKD
jgi:lipoprotein-anchoring transpeptidase ErfK/SrfK